MDKFRHLEIFAAAVQAGKFNRAAEQLGLSASAVSHAIRTLEDHLGVQLIRRDNRNFALTDTGQDYYDEIQPLLDQFYELDDAIRLQHKDLSGTIRLSAPVSYGSRVLNAPLARFMSAHPGLAMDLHFSDRFVDLGHDPFDLAVRIAEMPDSALTARRIGTIRMCLCASPSYAREHEAELAGNELHKLDGLIYAQTPQWQVTREGRARTLKPAGRLKASSGDAIAEFAVAGMGVAYLPEFLIRGDLDAGSLIRVLPAFDGWEYGVFALFPPGRHRPRRVQVLVEFLKKALEQK